MQAQAHVTAKYSSFPSCKKHLLLETNNPGPHWHKLTAAVNQNPTWVSICQKSCQKDLILKITPSLIISVESTLPKK